MGRIVSPEEYFRTGQTWVIDSNPATLEGIEIEPTLSIVQSVDYLTDPDFSAAPTPSRLDGEGDMLRRLAVELLADGLVAAGEASRSNRTLRVPTTSFILDITLTQASSAHAEIEFGVTKPWSPDENGYYALSSVYLWRKLRAQRYAQPLLATQDLTAIVEPIHAQVIK